MWRKDFLSDDPQPYWRDINDHVGRMVDLLELGTQTLESIQNIFVAKVILEMTQQSNTLNEVGGQLARVGTVFMPLTVITGMWGMNCKVPWQYDGTESSAFNGEYWGFCIVVGIIVLSSVFSWHLMNRHGKGQEGVGGRRDNK